MARHYFSEMENKAWVDYSYRVDGNTVYFTVDEVADNNSAASTDPNLYEIQWQGGLEVWDNTEDNNHYRPNIGEEISFTGSGDSITITTEVCFDCWSHDDVAAGASSPTESRYVNFSVSIDIEGGSGSDSAISIVAAAGDEDTSLHGTITFVGDSDNLSDRPATVTAVHMSTGNDYETVSFEVTGTSFEYSYGSGYNIGGNYDDGLRFNDIHNYILTTEPANDTYCNEKNVIYAYRRMVTVTIVGSSGNCEVVVEDEDGSYHSWTNNGTYTYQGLGVVALSTSYDHEYGVSGSIDLSDPFNVIVTFANPGATYTVNINIDFTDVTFEDSTIISYSMSGVTNDARCWDDIFDLTSDYSETFTNVGLSSDYELVITGYPDGITPVIYKAVNGTIINYSITWDNGSTPDEPDEPDTPDEENTTYIYTNGTWRATATYLYTNGTWKEVVPNILGTASTPSMEEESNEHGTTAVLNSYTTESNESGTTVIID